MADKKEAITVWKDGSWLAHSKGDAYYAAQGDPNWLVQINLDELGEPQKGRVPTKEEKETVEPVPIPATLEEALQVLDEKIDPSELEKFKDLDPVEQEGKFMGVTHHGLGQWIRNNWGLWGGSTLQDHLRGLGLQHADDMSGLILTCFVRRKFGRPLDIEGQVKHYQDYWAKMEKDADGQEARSEK